MITQSKADQIIVSIMSVLGDDSKENWRGILPYAVRDLDPILNVGVLRSVIEFGNQKCRIEIEFIEDEE